MYRRPRFLEILIAIREEMAREADFDVDLLVENVRNGHRPERKTLYTFGKEQAVSKVRSLAHKRTKRRS